MNLLKKRLNELNTALRKRGEKPLTYAQIGSQIDQAKSTVSAIFNETYSSDTRGAITKRIADLVMERLDSLAPHTSEERAKPKPRSVRARTSRTPKDSKCHAVDVHRTGFFTFRGKHYYAGAPFYGSTVLLQETAPARLAEVFIHLGSTRKLCWPIDPTDNQLGYPGNTGQCTLKQMLGCSARFRRATRRQKHTRQGAVA